MSDIHSLAGSYVVDALDAGDERAFTKHLESCDDCRSSAEEFREAAAELSWTVLTPAPDSVRAAVLAGIREHRQLPPSLAKGHTESKSARVMRRMSFALAASVLTVAGLGVGMSVLDNQHRATVTSAQVEGSLLSAPDAVVHPARTTTGVSVSVVTSKQQSQAVLMAAQLPALDSHHTYQAWLLNDGRPSPDSTFTPTPDGRVWLHGRVHDAQQVAVTIEPTGGSKSPTTPPVVVVNI